MEKRALITIAVCTALFFIWVEVVAPRIWPPKPPEAAPQPQPEAAKPVEESKPPPEEKKEPPPEIRTAEAYS